jgi:hypothetical protein
MPPPYPFSTHVSAAAARKMITFHDFAERLHMDVVELMKRANAKIPPTRALVQRLGQGAGY